VGDYDQARASTAEMAVANPGAADAIKRPLATLLTATGRGAIAVVRVSGPGSIRLVDAVFRLNRGESLAQTAPGRIRLGHIGTGRGDEVVAVVADERVETVELQCHGGPAPVEMVMRALEQAGAERSNPASLVESCAGDSIAAAASLDLCQAPTLQTAQILLEQAEGALRREIVGVIGRIDGNESLAPALHCLDDLIARSAIGLRLLTGWRVVITGRPNVGKSRLLNALAGFTRAIVDPTPGTTRDVVTLGIALEGWPIELADTAGLRRTCDPIEAEGIARSQREQSEADLNLLVLDRSKALQPMDRELVSSANRAIFVANKSDLPASWQPDELSAQSRSLVIVSAERGDGIPDLCAEIVRSLVPNPPGPGAAVPFRPRHLEALKRARQSLSGGDKPTAKTVLDSLIQS
jgi:tRNA modification GTPase